MLRKEPQKLYKGWKNTLQGDTWEAQLNRKDKHTVNWKRIKSQVWQSSSVYRGRTCTRLDTQLEPFLLETRHMFSVQGSLTTEGGGSIS